MFRPSFHLPVLSLLLLLAGHVLAQSYDSGRVTPLSDVDIDDTALRAASASTCATPTPTPAYAGMRALFTHGTTQKPDCVVRDVLVSAINGAPAGSEIHLVMYVLSDPAVTDALVQAENRGVKVRRLDGDTGVRFTRHVKFAAISSTGGVANWGFVSSYHPSGAATEKWQQTVTFSDEALYRGLVSFTDAIERGVRPPNHEVASLDRRSKLIFFPMKPDDGDYVAHVLANIDGKKGGAIDVAMARWTTSRIGLVDQLCALGRDGMKVRVATRLIVDKSTGEEDGATLGVRERLADCSYLSTAIFDPGDTNVHAKYLRVNAVYGGDGSKKTRQHLVWSGSHNFTGPAIDGNYELLLKTSDPGVYAAFVADFDAIWKRRPGQ